MTKVMIRSWIFIILKRNNKELVYGKKLDKYFSDSNNEKEKEEYELYKLTLRKVIDKLFLDNLYNIIKSVGNGSVEIARNNPIETGIVGALTLLLLKGATKTVSKLRTLFYLVGASALVLGYYFLDISTLKKRGENYMIEIGEKSHEELIIDISGVKDFILDGLVFIKIN